MQGIRCPQMLIGISGHAGAGKDTVAEILCESHGFTAIAFADALRQEIIQAFAIDPGLFVRDQKERKHSALAINRCGDKSFIEAMSRLHIDLSVPRSPREIMQWWGTEFRRGQDSRHWVKQAALAIDAAVRSDRHRIILTDVRFPNEAHLVCRLSGVIWRIHRPQVDQTPLQHESESWLNLLSPDFSIQNDQSLTRLAVKTLQAFSACFPSA